MVMRNHLGSHYLSNFSGDPENPSSLHIISEDEPKNRVNCGLTSQNSYHNVQSDDNSNIRADELLQSRR